MAVAKTGSAATPGEVNGTTLTYAYTLAADADCLVVGVGLSETSVIGTVTGVTYNGVAMTQVETDADAGTFTRVYLFVLVAPAVNASHNIVVSTTGTVDHIGSGAQGFVGVNQASPVSSHNKNHGNGATASVVVTSASGEWTMDTVSSPLGPASPNQTQLWITNSSIGTGGSDAAGAASVTFQWTMTDVWAHVGLSLAASAPAVTPLSWLPKIFASRSRPSQVIASGFNPGTGIT